MPTKNIKLLLTENVDNLGIVGDVVNVRLGYARNFLLPRGLATQPSDELMAELATKRAEAEKQVAALRQQREEAIGKMQDLELTLQRSCNDQGILYGSVTQQDLSAALTELGHPVQPREVRIGQTIKRVGEFEVTVKLASDLEAHVKIHIVADRQLDEDERQEMEFDDEGNLIEQPKSRRDEGSTGKPADQETAAAEA
ncbi:MAG: 50S ribosomal protein L9 [Planctomycetota bacterium]